MFSLLTPTVDATPQGQITIQLREACRDLITDLAVKMAGSPELLDALDELAAADANLTAGPTSEASLNMLQAHLHALQDNVLEELGCDDSFTLYLHTMTARRLAKHLEREADLVALREGQVL